VTVAKVPLPLHTLLMKDASGPIVLRHGQGDLWVVVFTSLEYATDFAKRAKFDACVFQTLATIDDVKRYVTSRPNRSGKSPPPFLIVLDPIDMEAGSQFRLFKPEQFLQATTP
jgi:hypothetical protein